MDKLKLVLNIVQKQQTTLGFGLVALLTAGTEQIFSAEVFRCPCSSWNCIYGTVFLVVPALVLLVFGLLINGKTWRMCTGVCARERTSNSLKNNSSECLASLKMSWQIFITAMVAPVTWIAVALLSGNYFECARTCLANVTLFREHPCGNKTDQCVKELHMFPCEEFPVTVTATRRDAALATIRAESQVIGWLLIGCVMGTFLLLTCWARCRSPVSHMQLRFWQVYTRKENEQLDRYMADHAQKLVERNLTSFFEQTPPQQIVTPDAGAWAKVSSPFHFSKKKPSYSMLQKYVETALVGPSSPSGASVEEDSDVTPNVLGFVDSGGVIP